MMTLRGYLRATAVLVLCTIIGTVVLSRLSITDVAMIYLLSVALVASWSTRGEALFAAVLSVALFDFFFVPPRFTFSVSDLHYVFTFAVMFVTAVVISRLAEHVRSEARAAETRERVTGAFYPLTGDLLEANTLEDVMVTISRQVRSAFGADVRVLLRKEGDFVAAPGSSGIESDENLANVAYQTWQPAGRGTSNVFADATSVYLPLVGGHGRIGVLQIHPSHPKSFDEPAMQWLLQTFAAQAALAIERVSVVA